MDGELARIEKLKGIENWGTWKFQIRILIQANDAFEVVTGENIKPEPVVGATAAAVADFSKILRAWKKLDSMAQKTIVTTVSDQPLLHIINCQSSKEMWDKLHEIFENKSETAKHILQQQWYTLGRDATDSIVTHIAKIRDLAHRLCALGELMSDSMVMTKILMTLPSSYQHFNTAWESTSQEQRTLSNLTARLTMEELRKNSNDHQENGAFWAKAKQNQAVKGQNEVRKNDRKPGKCFKCGKQGHWKRDCRSKIEDRKNAGQSQDRGGAFVGEVVTTTALVSQETPETWFLDSGASQHMSPVHDWFVNYKELSKPIPVRIGNGEVIPAIGKGEIDILSYNGFKWERNYLAEVLYVPKLRYNLFSLSSALDKGLELMSDEHKCLFRKKGSVIAVGDRNENLYKMKFKKYNPKLNSSNTEQADAYIGENKSLRLWHEKLAHQNTVHVSKILKKWGIKTEAEKNWFCEGCALGKMNRKTFPISKSQANEPAELIHADLCGPMEQLSIGKSKFFLLFKNDYSHYRKVYFLKHKSDVTKLFEGFLRSVETELGRKVKRLRTDNGLEFVNKEMQELMLKNGIKHEKSTPNTPEQNGVIERENRTVVEAARSMLYAKRMDLRLWAEAVHTANYVLNRTGSSTVHEKTPHELWFGKSTNMLDLKVFGTKVYTHIPKQKRKKWSAKAKEGVFVGYDDCTKGYRIWFPFEKKSRIRSRRSK